MRKYRLTSLSIAVADTASRLEYHRLQGSYTARVYRYGGLWHGEITGPYGYRDAWVAPTAYAALDRAQAHLRILTLAK